MVFRSGGEVDEWLDELLEGAGADADEVVSLLDVVTPIRTGDGELDPHWWQDPRRAALAASAIAAPSEMRIPSAAPSTSGQPRPTRAGCALDRELAACFARVRGPAQPRTTPRLAVYLGAPLRARRGRPGDPLAVEPGAAFRGRRGGAGRADRGAPGERRLPRVGHLQKLEEAVSRESGAAIGGGLWTDSLGPEGSGAGDLRGRDARERGRDRARDERRERAPPGEGGAGRGSACTATGGAFARSVTSCAATEYSTRPERLDRLLELAVLEGRYLAAGHTDEGGGDDRHSDRSAHSGPRPRRRPPGGPARRRSSSSSVR